MQVSLNWLNELVDLSDIDVKQIAHELTMSGLEVEEVEEVKPKFTNIITAKIEKIDNHPNSDRLHLVTVNTDGEDIEFSLYLSLKDGGMDHNTDPAKINDFSVYDN